MTISKRLETIINMVDDCGTAADIGCDHGYVSIGLLRSGCAKRVIAADVAEGPLNAARSNAAFYGLGEQIRFVLSDGLRSIDDPSLNTIVIAGMGGSLVKSILEQADLKRFPHLKQLVLGPQSDLDIVRHYLIDELKFRITSETCLLDEGKYYFLMNVAVPADGICSGEISAPYEEEDYLYGRVIDDASADCYIDYLNFRKSKLCAARENAQKGSFEKNKEKLELLDHDIELVNKAIMKAGRSR